MRHRITLLSLLVCAAACNPISDWPHSKGGDDDITGGGPVGPSPVSMTPNNPGPVVTPPGAGGTASGTAGGGTTGAASPTTSAPGAADAGSTGGFSPTPMDAGVARDAGTSVEAGDAMPDAASPDGGVPDAQAQDAGSADAASDGGCMFPVGADAGACPGYGCRATLPQLRLAMDREGACTSNEALAQACAGRVTQVALECTQGSARSVNLGRAVSSCLKKDPQLAQLGEDCLDCYVDESLCMLSRCFAVCTAGDSNTCQACRRQHCSAPLELCTGLPTP